MDQLPRLGKRELICLLLFICNYVVSVWRGFPFLWVIGMGYLILLLHTLSLPYNYLARLSRRLIGELIVHPWSGVLSETVWPIKTKFYAEPPWVWGSTFCSRHLGHMTNMAATLIYGKNPSKSSFPEPAG